MDQGFYAVELDTYRPGASTIAREFAHGTRPHGALSVVHGAIEATATILASDLGYRSRSSDAGGVRVYPPIVSQAFAVDRSVNLDPSASGNGWSFGTVDLANSERRFDGIASTWNSDGRNVRVLYGKKTYDAKRGIFLDPPYASLQQIFGGITTPWGLSETTLSVPLRDASYWLERPLQTTLYAGTGGYEGNSDLAGRPKPKARGGYAAGPIQNITPVLIDPTNRIYQYNDAPGRVINLYEGSALTISNAGDTTNLYSGTTPSGSYRTDNSRGLFQLGSTPVAAITADVTGDFPLSVTSSNPLDIAQNLMTQDMLFPAGTVDTASIDAIRVVNPLISGFYFDGSDNITGIAAVTTVLQSMAASLIPARDGRLRAILIRSIPDGTIPVATLTTTEIVSITPQALPATLSPPPYRWRVAYAQNNTLQTSGYLGAATDARKQFVAKEANYATWFSPSIVSAYRRPNDHEPIGGGLVSLAYAQSISDSLGAFWGTQRRLYAIVVPVSIGLALDLGSVVRLTYPMDDLSAGRLGRVVGEQFRPNDGTMTFKVLV